MNSASFRYLVFLAFILAAAATFLMPSRLLNYLEAPRPTTKPAVQVDSSAPPLTAALASSAPVAEKPAPIAAPSQLANPILVYHHIRTAPAGQPVQDGLEVTPSVFRQQMNWLADNGWLTVGLPDLTDALKGRQVLPAKAVILTFDDGNRDQYQNAWPVLKELGLKATFFIYPNAIGRRDDFMTWDQVRELVAAGMDIGSHSRTHPRLYAMTDMVKIGLEVQDSKDWLEQETGVEVKSFAYPFGVSSQLVQGAVVKAGYRDARIYPYGPTNTPADVFQLNSVAAPASLNGFIRLMGHSQP